MVRFGVIGTGSISDLFMEAAKVTEGFYPAALYSRNREHGEDFAARHGIERVFTDLEEMAAWEGVDAVYVASPNNCHCGQSLLMMEHGKHVLCEKPVASNSMELKKMLETARKNHVVLLEAMRPVFDPGFAKIEELLPRLGTVRRATFQYNQYSSRYDKFKAGKVENAFNPALSNAAVMDIGVYCIHPLVKLFGMPTGIQVQSLILENGMEGQGTILAAYEGMLAELMYSKIANSKLPSQILGEEGSLVIRQIQEPDEIIWYPRNGEEEHFIIEKRENNMYYELRAFLSMIAGERSPEVYNQASVMEMEMMDQVRRLAGIRFDGQDPLF